MMITMDQRGSLAKTLNPASPDSVSYEQMEEVSLYLRIVDFRYTT